MRLIFQSPYLSIKKFPSIDIPDFCLITGKNGTGKSHLLKAITAGNVGCQKDGVEVNFQQDQIRFYDWSTLVPQETGVFSSEAARQERQNILNVIRQHATNNNLRGQIRNIASQMNLNRFSDEDLLHFGPENFGAHDADESKYVSFISQRKSLLRTHGKALRQNPQFQTGLTFLGTPKSVFALDDNDILSPSLPNWGTTRLFQQSFARLFVEYRDLNLRNELAELKRAKGFPVPVLTASEFEAQHGPAPWDFVNRSLEAARLDFLINSPDPLDYSPFQPRLTKKSTGDTIAFGDLSSGEKIIISFAFCLYYSTDRRQLANYPKVLLLDEIDAPLHPSMTRSLLQTITRILVDQSGVSVIATTHSPSTAALSPEGSIYVMVDGSSGLRETSKSEALNVLTEGVPTLALSYSGRRQIFVESDADAATYSLLFNILKRSLNSERSLEFMSTGMKSSAGTDRNTGCDLVRKLVKETTAAGNSTIFGILDWDGKHTSDARIEVLAQGKRNGLENVVLDPLVIAATICRECGTWANSIGVPDGMSYYEFLSQPPDFLQSVVDRVSKLVLKQESVETVAGVYLEGMELQHDLKWHLIDDHELERAILDAFPPLKGIAKERAGQLMQQIVRTVLSDRSSFIPSEINDLFVALLSKESHFQI